MAATNPQRQLLTLIRDFASEKSQGERKVVRLKKRIEELGCEVDAANEEMEVVRRFKETTEQELKGYELQLAFNNAFIKTLEVATTYVASGKFQEEGLESQKKRSIGTTAVRGRKKGRDIYPSMKMSRQIDVSVLDIGLAELHCVFECYRNVCFEADCKAVEKVVTDIDLSAIEDVLAHVASQTTKEEQEYLAEENIQKQVQEEYVDLQSKVSIVEYFPVLLLYEIPGQNVFQMQPIVEIPEPEYPTA
ncbi:unnamed protein product [Dovyalis caffra]|uniref:Uncharacterized protein n=1 Tax=Dovyalis caffra TaxID=77055 RepID=A0AAV1R4S8_9ROSI|nr:unnamed protein product [Dovyalis caffra]